MKVLTLLGAVLTLFSLNSWGSPNTNSLTCQLLKVKDGRVIAESNRVQVQGFVNITISDFTASDGVEATISGSEQDKLQLSVYETTTGISSTTLYSVNSSLNFTIAGARFTLVCLPE